MVIGLNLPLSTDVVSLYTGPCAERCGFLVAVEDMAVDNLAVEGLAVEDLAVEVLAVDDFAVDDFAVGQLLFSLFRQPFSLSAAVLGRLSSIIAGEVRWTASRRLRLPPPLEDVCSRIITGRESFNFLDTGVRKSNSWN